MPDSLKATRSGSLTTVTLNRPDSHNALNAALIEELTRCFEELAEDEQTRVVVLAGEGRLFCAGADVGYMRETAGLSYEENLEDARRLAMMFWTIDESPKPVVAKVQGVAMGGGAGLLAAADVVVADSEARFAFSEIRLGIVPATISPFVVRKIGVSHARSLFLTGERFGAERAREIDLVANRGEIAVRIIRTCRELGVKSIAVYSEADEHAMHRRLADESYLLGPPPAPESYLNVGRLVEVIERSGAEAVHPGYGFLSESAEFARAAGSAGAVWVGPPPEAMDAVGYKVRAKELARRAGVPTIPGYDGKHESESRLAEEADRIGYPVLVKASAGGGGRGMRAVTHQRDFVEAGRGAGRGGGG